MTAPTLDTPIETPPCPSPKPAAATADGHHGTPNGYRRGCRNACCLGPNRRYKKRQTRFGKLKVDPAPAIKHIQKLLNEGATQKGIAEAAETSPVEIWAILTGRHPTIRQATRDRILAVTQTVRFDVTDATGTVRRLRALIADGHTAAEITAAFGISTDTITRVLRGTLEIVSVRTANTVTAAYKAMAHTEGTSARNRLRGKREQWAPPECWDDINIDDPEAFPDWTGHCGTVRGYHLHHKLHLGFLCNPCRAARSIDRAERKAASASPGEPS